MFDYTRKLTLDTFDYIKKILFIFDLFFQIFYIIYLGYRIYVGAGLLPANIVLLSLSVFYFIFYLCSRHEFNTKKELNKIKKVKEFIKITKRLVNLCVIVMAVIQLVNNTADTSNLDLLLTVLMIMGYVLSIFFDIFSKIIDNRIELFKCAFSVDLIEGKRKIESIPMLGPLASPLIGKISVNESEINDKIIAKLKTIKHKQEEKARRKEHYFKQKDSKEIVKK